MKTFRRSLGGDNNLAHIVPVCQKDFRGTMQHAVHDYFEKKNLCNKQCKFYRQSTMH